MSATAMTPEEQYWTLKLERAAKALEANHFGVSIHPTAQDAAKHLVDDMLGGEWKGSVNFGGSASVLQSGVVDRLLAHPGADVVPTYNTGENRELIARLRKERYICDLFLCSSNAVTMDGQLLNLDGTGNRVASMIFGPEKVVLFVGRNKLCESMDTARERVRHVASPMNNMRLQFPNPCVPTARCHDCRSPRRICNYWSIIERSSPPQRIHVLLINQDLGF